MRYLQIRFLFRKVICSASSSLFLEGNRPTFVISGWLCWWEIIVCLLFPKVYLSHPPNSWLIRACQVDSTWLKGVDEQAFMISFSFQWNWFAWEVSSHCQPPVRIRENKTLELFTYYHSGPNRKNKNKCSHFKLPQAKAQSVINLVLYFHAVTTIKTSGLCKTWFSSSC